MTPIRKFLEALSLAVRRRIEPERHPVPVIAAQPSFVRVLHGYAAIKDQRLSIVQVTSVTPQVLALRAPEGGIQLGVPEERIVVQIAEPIVAHASSISISLACT